MDVCNIKSLGYVFRLYWLPCIVVTLHIPTFQWHWSLFRVYSFASIHRALSFYYHFKYPVQFETVEFHDTAKSDESSPWFQTQCCNENKNHQHLSFQFFSVCLSVVHYCCLEFYSCIDEQFLSRPSKFRFQRQMLTLKPLLLKNCIISFVDDIGRLYFCCPNGKLSLGFFGLNYSAKDWKLFFIYFTFEWNIRIWALCFLAIW